MVMWCLSLAVVMVTLGLWSDEMVDEVHLFEPTMICDLFWRTSGNVNEIE
jgi:hypothetical protein